MASGDAALDAVVDRLLLGSGAPSHTSHTQRFDDAGVVRSFVQSVTRPAPAPASAQSQASPSVPVAASYLHEGQKAVRGGEEGDLNALVERILAGPRVSDVASAASSRRLDASHHEHLSSPPVLSPSISPVSSSPRYPLSHASAPPQRYASPHYHHHRQQKASTSRSTSGCGGGATRADASLARSTGGGLLHTHTTTPTSAAAAAAAASSMNAVVRRLTLWQERREAKRVQFVYEALEREQEDCTFEPSINRLGEGGDRRSASHTHSRPRRPSLSSSSGVGRARAVSGEQGEHYVHDQEGEEAESESEGYPPQRGYHHHSTGRSSTSRANRRTTSASCTTATDLVPSLLPPSQPIYGVHRFVDRIRRAQEEKDAVKDAEEAKRLRHYDPAFFHRDLTVPEPFEFGDTRPRRPPISTAAVVGMPSPLTRLRVGGAGAAAAATGGGGVPLTSSPSRVSLTPSGVVAGGSAAVVGRSPFSHTLGPPTPRDHRADYGGDGDETVDMMMEDRLTAENTFLSLAPQIRESLLFDRQMEQQLQRATQSIRPGTA